MANKSFSIDISKFVEKTKLKGSTIVRKLSFDLLRGVMLRSPVDTGRYRANWRVSVNAMAIGWNEIAEGKEKPVKGSVNDAAGKEALNKGNATLANVKWGDQINITNSVPYAIPLENGHSDQAKDGVMWPTVMEVVGKFQQTVESVK